MNIIHRTYYFEIDKEIKQKKKHIYINGVIRRKYIKGVNLVNKTNLIDNRHSGCHTVKYYPAEHP